MRVEIGLKSKLKSKSKRTRLKLTAQKLTARSSQLKN